MKLTVLVFFILFLLLLATAGEGVRLDKGSLEDLQQKEESFVERTTADILCGNGLCAEIRRNLLTTTTAAAKVKSSDKKETTTTQENTLKEDRVRKELKNSSSNTGKPAMEQKEISKPETYPDLIDIAGMDYSPAKRKPPIHN